MSTSNIPSTDTTQPAGADILGGDILGGNGTPDHYPVSKPHKPFYRQPLFIIVLVLVVILAALGIGRLARHTQQTQYQTTAVAKGTFTLSVSATGNVTTPEYDVMPQSLTETITAIDVHIGQQVKSGATLATLSYTDASGSSRTETLTTPGSGTVTAINGNVNGKPTSQTTFITIDDLTSPDLTLNVNESDIASVATGQQLTFTATAYANLTTPFKGSVKYVSDGGQNSNNVITYPVTASVDHSSLQSATLMPQMTVNATITTAQRDNALTIPNNALSFAETQANNHVVSSDDVSNAQKQAQTLLSQVQHSGTQAAKDDPTASYVLELQNNQLTVVPVVVGLSNGNATEILAGLSEGTNVVVG